MYSYVRGNSRKEDSCCCLSPFCPNVVFVIPAPISAALLCSRRHKLHIVCFRVNTKARSFRCSSSSPKSLLTFRGPRLAFSFSPIFQVRAFRAERCFGKMTKQKEPITQNIRNRPELCSRFKVVFYVIGSEKSKSGSASYSSRWQNQLAWWSSSALPVYRYPVG